MLTDNKPSLNQITNLTIVIIHNENLNQHFDLSNVWELLWNYETHEARITDKQKSYLLHLIFSKKYTKLNEMMYSLGFKQLNL